MPKCIVQKFVVFRSAVASCTHSQHSAVASCTNSQHSAVASCTHSQHSAVASCTHCQHSAATLRTIIYLQLKLHIIAPVTVCDNFPLLFPTADLK